MLVMTALTIGLKNRADEIATARQNHAAVTAQSL
jgi:hypothetical protein